jgi:hypothetical protein
MEISKHSKSERGHPVFKPRIEGIGGRKAYYTINELANMDIPEGYPNGCGIKLRDFTKQENILNKIITPIRGAKLLNNIRGHKVILAMEGTERPHMDNSLWMWSAVREIETNKIRLFVSTNYSPENDNNSPNRVECVEDGWYVTTKCSLTTDIEFWQKLKEICKTL